MRTAPDQTVHSQTSGLITQRIERELQQRLMRDVAQIIRMIDPPSRPLHFERRIVEAEDVALLIMTRVEDPSDFISPRLPLQEVRHLKNHQDA